MRSIFLTLILAIAATAPSRAADSPPADPVLAEATDLAGAVMFMESGAPGMVLAIVRGDHSLVLGYGETKKGNKRKPDGDSLLRLNSITKVFATEVLASLVAEGKLSLTDSLQRYAGDATVPTFGARPITLLDLATHSAALPREMGEAPSDALPRAWPTREDRWKWLPSYKLPWAPGAIAAYSNIGFDLLADAIASAGGQAYPDLLRKHVTAPLDMRDTGFAPTPEQCDRLMIGTGLGGAGPCVNTHATDGSGGLYSTGNDMARWLRHNIQDADGALALSHAVYRQRQALQAAIGFDEAGPMAGLGLGWVIVAGRSIHPTLVAKSGGGVGFMSYIAFAPGRNVGLFVAVNRVDFAMFSRLTDAANALIATLVTR
ncbi:D-alanyl-D-alanine-carboxypeptidase/endopeptidase AmpH [Methylocapsa aurea]|uniref:D-alanyl-D-alanine- carboxypeptidase/endopeptidase AmpH n=1 Tax=Methylocapsa aurea TaxID=663610 RepID=UPI000567C345|nr:D-alanyl-D-alanine-carboxypeptidase/endopeptidase AmpH [Methylocapsa aurea]